jgi:protein-S-isoprenylcysteine O-methyltransferase Ste14/rhodanese-related sulfurtransferase
MEATERALTIISYLTASVLVVFGVFAAEGSTPGVNFFGAAAVILLVIPAALLFIFSLFGLITYFVFIPSIKGDGHLFSRVHGSHLLHPLTTSIVLGLLGFCILVGSHAAWALWGVLFTAFSAQTILFVRRLAREQSGSGSFGTRTNVLPLLVNLMVGGELVTIAGGARPLPPWRLRTLPEDTWIVDVRTKPEFHWNRLSGAENYPWGEGLVEAARSRPKDRPVLVTCFSGHRSPSVAATMRKLGFTTVYNLNWGILYLILLERGRKSEGPFSLTRPHRDPNRRGEDVRAVAQAYVALLFGTLVGAPVESVFLERSVPLVQSILGAALGLAGLGLGILSFRALGRNFRVYAAPRRSGTLITGGVYSRIRHPMYTGVIIGLLGYVLFFGSTSFLPVWLAVVLLYVIKAVKEERILADKYPDYEQYRMRTWRFLPYVY